MRFDESRMLLGGWVRAGGDESATEGRQRGLLPGPRFKFHSAHKRVEGFLEKCGVCEKNRIVWNDCSRRVRICESSVRWYDDVYVYMNVRA